MTHAARKTGLARALSKLGFCSRSKASELIRKGKVALNGKVRHDPETPVALGADKLEVDGKPISRGESVYLVLNKPRGVVTTASDDKGRKTVYSLLAPDQPWVAPVGRLDMASEGLLLMTNDPEWAAEILDPATHLAKTYHVQVNAVAQDRLLRMLVKTADVQADDMRATSARILRGGQKNTWLEIVLDEGKNRQIRRLFEQLDIEVLRLVRVAIGPLPLGELRKGEVRRLSVAEKQSLDREMKRSLLGRQG